jgi:hypothetical protein
MNNPMDRIDPLGLYMLPSWTDYVPILRIFNQLQPQPGTSCHDYHTPYPVNTDEPYQQAANNAAIANQLAAYEAQQILPTAFGDIVDAGGLGVDLATGAAITPIGAVGAVVLVGEGTLSTSLTIITLTKMGKAADQASKGCP